jgi:hypothetical protein
MLQGHKNIYSYGNNDYNKYYVQYMYKCIIKTINS